MIGKRLSYWGDPGYTRLKNLMISTNHRVCELPREVFFDLVYIRLKKRTNWALHSRMLVDTQ